MKDFLEGKPFRHPLHPFLAHFPIGLFLFSFLLDLATWVLPPYSGLVRAAFYSMALGIVTALIAALPGVVDYTGMRRDHPAKKTATAHMLLNFAAVGLYALNLGLRFADLDELRTPALPFLLSLTAVALLSVSGYLGGAMVYDDGISVGRHRRRTATPEDTIQIETAKLEAGLRCEEGGFLYVRLPRAGDLNDGETLRVEVDGAVMTVVKLDEQLHAFQEFCTHRFGPLSEGSFQDGQVKCPWHCSCFDVRTGEVTHGPAKEKLKTFPMRVREGHVEIGVPRQDTDR